MTTTFEANFRNVEAVEDRTVSPRGEVFGLSRFKKRNVKIMVLKDVDCNDPSWQKYPYQVELDAHTYSSDTKVEVSGNDAQIDDDTQYTPTTKEIMEAI